MTILSANIYYDENNEPTLDFVDDRYRSNTNSFAPGDAGYEEAVAIILEKQTWLAPVFEQEVPREHD